MSFWTEGAKLKCIIVLMINSGGDGGGDDRRSASVVGAEGKDKRRQVAVEEVDSRFVERTQCSFEDKSELGDDCGDGGGGQILVHGPVDQLKNCDGGDGGLKMY